MEQTEETPTAPTAEQTKAEFEQAARERLAGYWTVLECEPHYPASSETVIDLLSAAEYAIDHDYLVKAMDDRMVPFPPRHGGRLLWMAKDICVFMFAMEFRRRWKPFARSHQHKLTQFEKLTALAGENNGQTGCFADLNSWDTGGLIALLYETGCDLPARQAIGHALKLKLAVHGIEV